MIDALLSATSIYADGSITFSKALEPEKVRGIPLAMSSYEWL